MTAREKAVRRRKPKLCAECVGAPMGKCFFGVCPRRQLDAMAKKARAGLRVRYAEA